MNDCKKIFLVKEKEFSEGIDGDWGIKEERIEFTPEELRQIKISIKTREDIEKIITDVFDQFPELLCGFDPHIR